MDENIKNDNNERDIAIPVRIKNADSEATKVFIQTLNPTNGKLEWQIEEESYDYIQEIARSAYADMLHDDERNELYLSGIKKAVEEVRSRGEAPYVLDIGTGTGLLSMMAVNCGAHHVTACEVFQPMAKCAEKIIAVNNMSDKITVVQKRSTSLSVGPGLDMEKKANILVAELLDTELIGEGAIDTYLHAKYNLLTEDAILVPSTARIYAQVVSSPLLHSYFRPYSNIPPHLSHLNMPQSFQNCRGSNSVHDIQLSQIPKGSFIPVSEPVVVFEFDWSGRTMPLTRKGSNSVTFTPTPESVAAGAESNCVLMWWDTSMDQQGEIVLSCAPYWQKSPHSGPNGVPWRDHWMQAVYHLPPPLQSTLDSSQITLTATRDAYSMWFTLTKDKPSGAVPAPYCDCGVHISTPRYRLAQLADDARLKVYRSAIEGTLHRQREPSAWLILGDSASLLILGALASNSNVSHVYVHESTSRGQTVLMDFIKANEFQERITILPENMPSIRSSHLKYKVGVVFSEPHFHTAILPWHNLRVNHLLKLSKHFLSPFPAASADEVHNDDLNKGEEVPPCLTPALVLPGIMDLYVMPVCFLNLWKIRAPCQNRCGFDLTLFDNMITKARNHTDDYIECQPLWEYPCYALAAPVLLFSLNLNSDIMLTDTAVSGAVPLDLELLAASTKRFKGHRKSVYGARSRGRTVAALPADSEGGGEDDEELYYNGVAVWCSWRFGEEVAFTTGPVEEVVPGTMVSWDKCSHQGVHLARESMSLLRPELNNIDFHYDARFKQGDFTFNFTLEKV